MAPLTRSSASRRSAQTPAAKARQTTRSSRLGRDNLSGAKLELSPPETIRPSANSRGTTKAPSQTPVPAKYLGEVPDSDPVDDFFSIPVPVSSPSGKSASPVVNSLPTPSTAPKGTSNPPGTSETPAPTLRRSTRVKGSTKKTVGDSGDSDDSSYQDKPASEVKSKATPKSVPRNTRKKASNKRSAPSSDNEDTTSKSTSKSTRSSKKEKRSESPPQSPEEPVQPSRFGKFHVQSCEDGPAWVPGSRTITGQSYLNGLKVAVDCMLQQAWLDDNAVRSLLRLAEQGAPEQQKVFRFDFAGSAHTLKSHDDISIGSDPRDLADYHAATIRGLLINPSVSAEGTDGDVAAAIQGEASGSHWSLIVEYHQTLYYFDTLGSTAWAANAKDLYLTLLRNSAIPTEDLDFQIVQIPSQTSSFECGLMVAEIWHQIIHKYDCDPSQVVTWGEDLEGLLAEWMVGAITQLTASGRDNPLGDDGGSDLDSDEESDDNDFVYEDEALDDEDQDLAGHSLNEEEGDAPAEVSLDIQAAKQQAIFNLGLTDDMESGKSWSDMFLERIVGPLGSGERMKEFIRQNKGRQITPASEPIEDSMVSAGLPEKVAFDSKLGTVRTSWPSHDPIVDEIWADFVHDLVEASGGKIDAGRLSKPTGPATSLLAWFWHYPTNAVEVLVWGMITSARNPSIGQQVGKFGYPTTVYTHDFYPFRSKDGTTDDERVTQFGVEEFAEMHRLCTDFMHTMMAKQKYAILLGMANLSRAIPVLKERYNLIRMEVKFKLTFLVQKRPFFYLVEDQATKEIVQILFPFWHLSHFGKRYRTRSMESRVVADILLNAIGEIADVPAVNAWFMSDRGSGQMAKVKRPPKRNPDHAVAKRTLRTRQDLRRFEFNRGTRDQQDRQLHEHPENDAKYWWSARVRKVWLEYVDDGRQCWVEEARNDDPDAQKKLLALRSSQYSHRQNFNKGTITSQKRFLQLHSLVDKDWWGPNFKCNFDEKGKGRWVALKDSSSRQINKANQQAKRRSKFNVADKKTQEMYLEEHGNDLEQWYGTGVSLVLADDGRQRWVADTMLEAPKGPASRRQNTHRAD